MKYAIISTKCATWYDISHIFCYKMTLVNDVFGIYDICCLIIPFCSFKTIISLYSCNHRWKNVLNNEKSIAIFKKFIKQRFNFDDETELIKSVERNFFIREVKKYQINDSLRNLGKQVYAKAFVSKKGYDTFKNFYFKLPKIITKIYNSYEK